MNIGLFDSSKWIHVKTGM